jgi:ATP adenylyltransferase
MSHANLWAPWRMAYLRDLKRKADDAGGWDSASTGDFIVRYFADPPQRDRDNLVVYRNEHGLVLLNRYPYANGHLMAALGEARPRLLDYSPAQRAEFWRLTEIAIDLIQRALQPQGVNVGFNEGKAAGAGLPEHLHAHIIPRWAGDTNFITVVGQVRVIPGALEAMWETYRDATARSL